MTGICFAGVAIGFAGVWFFAAAAFTASFSFSFKSASFSNLSFSAIFASFSFFIGAIIVFTSVKILKMFSSSFLLGFESQTFVFRGIAISLIVSRWRLYPAFWSSEMSCFIVLVFSFISKTISSFFSSSASFTVSNFILDFEIGSGWYCFR